MGRPPWEDPPEPNEKPQPDREGPGVPLEVDPTRVDVEDLDLTGTMDLTETLMEGHEESLVRSLFEQIREHTVTEEDVNESRPSFNVGEEPPDLEDMEFEDWTTPSGAARVDAEGQPISVEVLWDAMEAAEREGLYPENGAFEWWVHHEHLHELRGNVDPTTSHPEIGRFEASEDYDWGFMGVPGRAFSVFPRGAILLLDPSILEPVHGVGSRAAQGVTVTDPRRIVRVTGIGRPE